MFKFKPIQRLLIEERRKNAALQANIQKNDADIEYIAMMYDVELETEAPGEEVIEDEQ